MKAILVINMPTECIECEFCRVFADDKPTETHCILTAQRNEDGINTIAEWCPLRPMPEKAAEDLVKGLDAMEKMQSVEVRTIRRTE